MMEISKEVPKQIFGLSVPPNLSLGEMCGCGKGRIPYWDGVMIYPYCGGCATIKDSERDRERQIRAEEIIRERDEYERQKKEAEERRKAAKRF